MLNETEFEVLSYFARHSDEMSGKGVAESFNISHLNFDEILEKLKCKNLIANNKLTDIGFDALEPYRVKRAIILAAGLGKRLQPVTFHIPKPLVKVNGKRIIDTQIEAILKAGIEEIYIVRGYLAEQFDELSSLYPMVTMIDNPIYDKANNIFSLMCVKNLLENSYIFDADLLICNPNIIKPYQYFSNILGRKTKKTDDWCYITHDNIIVEEKIGGTDCYLAYGIGYLNDRDGNKLSRDLQTASKLPNGEKYFWEQVMTTVFPDKYKIHIRECKHGDIIEIDTFDELVLLDKRYAEEVNNQETE